MFWRDTLQRRLAPESLTEVPLQCWAECSEGGVKCGLT